MAGAQQEDRGQISKRLKQIYQGSGGKPFARNAASAKKQLMTYGMGSGYQKPTLLDYPRMKQTC